MILVIVMVDQIIWRPTIAWAEEFKFEQVEAAVTPRSPVLEYAAPFERFSSSSAALLPSRCEKP